VGVEKGGRRIAMEPKHGSKNGDRKRREKKPEQKRKKKGAKN